MAASAATQYMPRLIKGGADRRGVMLFNGRVDMRIYVLPCFRALVLLSRLYSSTEVPQHRSTVVLVFTERIPKVLQFTFFLFEFFPTVVMRRDA